MSERASHGALDRFSPEALFVVSGISQYTGAVIAVSLFDDLGPATVAWLRVLGAAIVLVAIARRGMRGWTRAEIGAAALFGVATSAMNLFFYLAIDRIDLGKSVVIEFLGPIAVAAAFTRTTRNTIALVLAVAGVLVLGGVELDSEPLGLVFILAASTMWAAYIMVGRRVAALDRGLSGLALGLAIGALALAPIGAPGSGAAWTTPAWLVAGLGVGVFSNAIGYGIDQHVMRRIPVRRFALLLALLPVTAMVVGFLALDQRPSAIDLLGAAIVIAGVLVQERDVITPEQLEAAPA
ncbi:MAG: EamA family transporter [Acidimicrobiales bacterium]|nr:EamA family transporter [Acidimicrobiales bacterium]